MYRDDRFYKYGGGYSRQMIIAFFIQGNSFAYYSMSMSYQEFFYIFIQSNFVVLFNQVFSIIFFDFSVSRVFFGGNGYFFLFFMFGLFNVDYILFSVMSFIMDLNFFIFIGDSIFNVVGYDASSQDFDLFYFLFFFSIFSGFLILFDLVNQGDNKIFSKKRLYLILEN